MHILETFLLMEYCNRRLNCITYINRLDIAYYYMQTMINFILPFVNCERIYTILLYFMWSQLEISAYHGNCNEVKVILTRIVVTLKMN